MTSIEGYVNPDGSGRGNWHSERDGTKTFATPYERFGGPAKTPQEVAFRAVIEEGLDRGVVLSQRAAFTELIHRGLSRQHPLSIKYGGAGTRFTQLRFRVLADARRPVARLKRFLRKALRTW